MLSDRGALQLYDEQNIRESGRRVIHNIRTSEPSRRIRSRSNKASTLYASVKMGLTIQAEDNLGLAFVILQEHDDQVYELWDQPPPIPLSYKTPAGRTTSFTFNASFFILSDDFCGWMALWDAERLKKHAEKHPTRFTCGSDARWHDSAGEAYAAQYGLGFRIITAKDIDSVALRNASFLSDYLRHDCPPATSEAASAVLELIGKEVGISLSDLLEQLTGATSDDVYKLIAQERMYVDITLAPLSEPTDVRCFRDREQARLYTIAEAGYLESIYPQPRRVSRKTGELINWDGRPWMIVNAGETEIILVNPNDKNETVPLPNNFFEQLITQGKITGLLKQEAGGLTASGSDLMQQASPSTVAEATRRFNILQLEEKKKQKLLLTAREEELLDSITARTRRRWRREQRSADIKYGNPQLGLLAKRHKQGNRTHRYPSDYLKALQDFLMEYYFSGEQPTIGGTYMLWLGDCLQSGRSRIGRKTFGKLVRLFKSYENECKRKGSRGAYADKPSALFFWYLDLWVPPHGEYPLHIAHIDHTQLDIELRCSRTGKNLGKPWLTLLICARTRRILAIYLSFDPPSYRSNMMVIRICARRYGHLPAIIVADGGKDFHGQYFLDLLARYGSSLRTRPPAEARFGNVLERLFGTTHTQFIYQLKGNTKVMKGKLREVTNTVDPKELARWPLAKFYALLCEWSYEIYDRLEHSTLGESPRDAFTRGIAQSGRRDHLDIFWGRDFIRDTLPTTDKGTAKIQRNKGIKINNTYYANPIMKRPEFVGLDVHVKYDPWNYGIIYAYIKKTKEGKDPKDEHQVIGWIECRSQHYNVFRGMTERQILIASEELRRRHNLHGQQIPDALLANFLLKAKQIEKQLDEEWHATWMLEQSRTAENNDVMRDILGDLLETDKSPAQDLPQDDNENGASDNDGTDATPHAENKEDRHGTTRKDYGTY